MRSLGAEWGPHCFSGVSLQYLHVLAASWNIARRLFPITVKTKSFFFVKDFKQYLSESSTAIDAHPICVRLFVSTIRYPMLTPLKLICGVISGFYLNLNFCQIPHCIACKIGWQSFNKRKKMNAARKRERERSHCQMLMTCFLQCEWDEDWVGAGGEEGGVHSSKRSWIFRGTSWKEKSEKNLMFQLKEYRKVICSNTSFYLGQK